MVGECDIGCTCCIRDSVWWGSVILGVRVVLGIVCGGECDIGCTCCIRDSVWWGECDIGCTCCIRDSVWGGV